MKNGMTTKEKYDAILNSFFDINLDEADRIINQLTNVGNASNFEKLKIEKIIDEWLRNASVKAHTSKSQMETFVACIRHMDDGNILQMADNSKNTVRFELLIDIAGLNDEYKALRDTFNEYKLTKAILENISMQKPELYPDMSPEETEQVKAEYNYKRNMARAELTKVENRLCDHDTCLATALLKNKNVINLLDEIELRTNRVINSEWILEDKIGIAKAKLMVSDETTRTAVEKLISLTDKTTLL